METSPIREGLPNVAQLNVCCFSKRTSGDMFSANQLPDVLGNIPDIGSYMVRSI